MKKLAANSFKKKLVIAFLSVGLIPLIMVSILYLNILNNRILRDSETASLEKLKYLSFNIGRQAEMAEQLLGWITYNNRLQDILTTAYSHTYEKQLDIIKFSSYVTEYSINANMESNIIKILIMDESGGSFQMGNGYSLLRTEDIKEAGWLENYQRKPADELETSMDHYLRDTLVFPMSSRIYDNLTGEPVGWCLIVFENTMYSNYLIKGTETEGSEELFLLNREGQCIADTGHGHLGRSLSEDPLIQEILLKKGEKGNVTGKYKGESSILHYYRIEDTGMTAIKRTSLETFHQEKRNMTKVAAVFIVFTTGAILLAVYCLSNMLMCPIDLICAYIKKVPGSGFKGNLSLKGDDEFKRISQSINTMELEILQLMEEQTREAEVKKQLEFKVLQNQINPHFLYNTLNSIKWMAALQHADTIRDMTAALGRLLQNISKGTDNRIPIYEEMSLLDDYILIQDIRYGGKIQVEYHIGNSEVTKAYIIKFLLQPIVENAVFHGIEPKEGTGRIDIYLEQEGKDLFISVVDDGIGMTPEQIEGLLNPDKGETHGRGLNGIGVNNIRERIKMTYGSEYGLEITSQPGSFTRVTIKIPYEKEG